MPRSSRIEYYRGFQLLSNTVGTVVQDCTFFAVMTFVACWVVVHDYVEVHVFATMH
jgi:hypothetical protein